MTERVLVTGAALHCALGNDVEAVWSRMLAGETRVEAVPSHWDAPLRSRVWSPVALPAADELGFNRQEAGMLDPVTQLATDCAMRALGTAGFELTPRGDKQNTIAVSGLEPNRCGVYLGNVVLVYIIGAALAALPWI